MPLSALQYSCTIPQKEKFKYAFTHEMMHFIPRTPVPCNCDCDEAPGPIRANRCLRQAQDPKIYKTGSHAGGKQLEFCEMLSLTVDNALLIK